MSLSSLLVGLTFCTAAMIVTLAEAADDEAPARRFIAGYEGEVRPLEIGAARGNWTANITGTDEDFRKKEEIETQLDLKLSDPRAFAELKAIHEHPPADLLLRREIEVLYLEYLPKQVEPELLKQMLAESNLVEQMFNVFRPKVAGREMTDNEVRRILATSKDSAQRRAAWEASKAVGRQVEPHLKRLVKLRNQNARKLGFKNYHEMALYVNEQSPQQVLALFDELDTLTRQPFHEAKAELDAVLARNCGITPAELRPWHYHDPFFQEAPEAAGAHFDQVYAHVDIPRLCRDFYAGIGLPVDDVLARSDLFEKKGKCPHAFCFDIDRQGDVRVLTNIIPNEQWLETLLHELGHSVYSSKNIPAGVPWALRCESHILTTEGVAMMFERFADDAGWLSAMGVKLPDPAAFRRAANQGRRNRLLIFSRWCQVMFRFEMALHDNPDQDLNRLWWDLVEKYQELRRPAGRNEPDYAAKIHVVSAPAYYHNYMLGRLFASQVHHAIAREVLHGADPATAVYVGNKEAGRFMKERVFAPGRTVDWRQLTRQATGEDLNPKAFAEDIRRSEQP
ncbi:MAG: M2 family metallopeptidase [Thermoguttaceae bacterium]